MTNKNYYCGVCGSRSHDLALPFSDYDIIYCANYANTINIDLNPNHIITVTPQKLFQRLSLQRKMACDLQLFFPEQILIETDLSQYLFQTREDLIQENKITVYDMYLFFCNYFNRKLNDPQHYRYNKNITNACLYCDILNAYKNNDISFEEVFTLKHNPELKQWILEARLNHIPVQDMQQRYKELYLNAKQCFDCYNQKPDVKKQQCIINDIKGLLDL